MNDVIYLIVRSWESNPYEPYLHETVGFRFTQEEAEQRVQELENSPQERGSFCWEELPLDKT